MPAILIWFAVPVLLGIPLIWVIRVVRGFGKWQDMVQSSWSDLDVALLRKHDLILKLIEAVRPFVDSDPNAVSDVSHLEGSRRGFPMERPRSRA